MNAFVLIVIGLSVGAGLFAYSRFGRRGGTISEALAVIRSVFFIVAGVGLIIGGFVVLGMIVITLFVYLGVGAGSALKNDLARRKIGGA